MRLTPFGFCLGVIVNENPLNLEKTTSRVLSVLLLIYIFWDLFNKGLRLEIFIYKYMLAMADQTAVFLPLTYRYPLVTEA